MTLIERIKTFVTVTKRRVKKILPRVPLEKIKIPLPETFVTFTQECDIISLRKRVKNG